MSNDNPQRILISRLSAIGDCVETMPLACALKHEWPDCEITWLVDCAAEQLLKIHPAVDHVIRVRKGFLKKPASILKLRRQLRECNFDLAIDPQGLLKSALVGWLSGAKRRIGFNDSQARERAWWFYTDRVTATRKHLVDRHLQLLEPLGIANPRVEFGLPVAESDANWCADYLRSQHLTVFEFVIVNPGAGWPSKLWPADRFGCVAQELWSRYQIRTLSVWSGDEEYKMAQEITRHCPSAVIAPNTSLTQLAALLASCRFVVASDTGPMHMAVALGTTCVALFSVTDPSHCGPYGSQHKVIQKVKMPDMTSRERRNCNNAAMCEIQVDDVMAACSDLLYQTQNRRSTVFYQRPAS